MDKLFDLNAMTIREKIINKEIRCIDLIEKTFERIEKIDKVIGSFVSLRKEKALEEAREIDRKIASGESLGSLAGVPVAIKDNMVSEGELCTASSRMLENYVGVYDSTVVKKIKAADGIIIGSTNMDEFAMGSSTRTSYHKMTKNPWDLERIPGGSSGGAAAAVAAKEVFITLGSDTGGSIRQPASFCGIVGMKPTYGRVSRHGLIAFASSMDQIGPFGKTVSDVAFMMNIISGKDEYDATVSDIEIPDYTEFLNKDIKGMKIGIPKEYFKDEMRPEIRDVVENSLKKFKELGAEIIEISLPFTKYAIPTYYVLAPAEASSNLARFDGVRYGHKSNDVKNIDDLYINSRTEGFGSEVKRRIMIGTYVLSAGFYDAYFKKAQKVRKLIQEDFEKVFKEVDIILTPVVPNIAFKLSEQKTPIELYLEDIYTIPANLAGIPGISIPAGLVDGLPVGIQLLGKAFDEGTLISAGNAFENIRGAWNLPGGDF
ncbi:Asp-tRNA(Asn)/Glu-tRNA(Gln) amidotransferase subunit GatA [Fusobacterium sp. PH5-44]|uniref:Asp-tRNA(Asn)/Glu-tRNA(Gln) amidotransferase subunit GatA n=1 Tax=unclassified Fusobacterium TaxID=2648384 RepID=UPI003D251109